MEDEDQKIKGKETKSRKKKGNNNPDFFYFFLKIFMAQAFVWRIESRFTGNPKRFAL